MKIEKAAVIGAGVMGSGIAAHFANAGIPVVLLDIVPRDLEDGGDRSKIARDAIAKLLKTDPAPLMHKRNARLITPGNIDDDLEMLKDADWIVEAIIERADIKRGLYEKLEKVRAKDSVVSSNTSTIPLHMLTDDMPESFRKSFIITHYFNPPRYLRLLEIVPGEAREDAVKAVADFADRRLGKTVIMCHDTPGFIANRIGTMWIQAAVDAAFDLGVTVEEADAIAGRPMGVPKTGIFGLLDLVGIDLIPHVGSSLQENVPEGDPFKPMYKEHDRMRTMIDAGYTGRKGKGGFYRLNREGGKKVKEAIDLETGDYAPADRKPGIAAVEASKKDGLRGLLSVGDKYSDYAWQIIANTYSYSALLVPEIVDTIHDVDRAMKLGYNWKKGPFEMIDEMGAAWFADKLRADGRDVPPLLEKVRDGKFYRVTGGQLQYFGTDGEYHNIKRKDGVLRLEDIKRAGAPLASNKGASVWDIGEGVLCLEFHSKMNSIDPDILTMLETAIDLAETRYKALVIHNEADNFSVGANIGLALFAANMGMWPAIESMVAAGQQAYRKLKFAKVPVVGAPSGMALGGGCEVLLHCAAIQAHSETYAGLVEAGVGLVPGWGGCKEYLLRQQAEPKALKPAPMGPMPAASKAFELISTAEVARSADQAREMKILRDDDEITMNRDRLLFDARAKALALAEGYQPPEPAMLRLPGPSGKAAFRLSVNEFAARGLATPYDTVVADQLATVLSGGDTDVTEETPEDRITTLEHRAFMALMRDSRTLDRMSHMINKGKPLRN